MFTGIIEDLGVVARPGKSLLEIKVPARMRRLPIGASLSVNGACLTVSKKKGGRLFFYLLKETRLRTNLARLGAGERVNLERPLKWKGRVGGHFVPGHVDGTGRVLEIKTTRSEKSFLIRPPADTRRFIREKGSIALNGVSLTVGKVRAGAFWAHAVPLTLARTNLGDLRVRDRVNLEADRPAKSVPKKRKNLV